jgi:uncharacterized protein (DUF486 family)
LIKRLTWERRHPCLHAFEVKTQGRCPFEYLFQVPANRIGYTALSLPQLKNTPRGDNPRGVCAVAIFYMRQPLKLDYLWAGLCLLAAVYFVFRSH